MTLRESKRIKKVQQVTGIDNVINVIKSGEEKNFSESEYSQHSESYMELEKIHKIETDLMNL